MQLGNVLQDFTFAFEFGILALKRSDAFDFLALKAPKIKQAEFFLFVFVEVVEFYAEIAPGAERFGDFSADRLRFGVFVQELALGNGREEKLLFVLAVNIA